MSQNWHRKTAMWHVLMGDLVWSKQRSIAKFGLFFFASWWDFNSWHNSSPRLARLIFELWPHSEIQHNSLTIIINSSSRHQGDTYLSGSLKHHTEHWSNCSKYLNRWFLIWAWCTHISSGAYWGLGSLCPLSKYDLVSHGFTSEYGWLPRVNNSHTNTP